VVGSINLDLVATVPGLPRAGETVAGGELMRVAGGKGANQAVAAARMGADVRMIGCVGSDAFAEEALSGLRQSGVDLRGVRVVDGPTGLALVTVDGFGDNTIVISEGANSLLRPEDVCVDDVDAVLSQQEVPALVVERAATTAPRFFLNASPARPRVPVAELVIVNRFEAEALEKRVGLVCVTEGPSGAVLFRDGVEIARGIPPRVDAVDGTAAGDAFAACLVVSLLADWSYEDALARACAAGALAASRFGAQTSLPTAEEVDAIVHSHL
jgi:ribokinase